MVVQAFRATVLASTVLLSACNSSSEPQKTFNLCVHGQGETFVPGSTGEACAVTQPIREGQIRTVELEADLYSGVARTATLAIASSPNGWTASLGGTTIPVPGKQTLTFGAPQDPAPGVYQIVVRATSEGEVVTLIVNIAVTSPL